MTKTRFRRLTLSAALPFSVFAAAAGPAHAHEGAPQAGVSVETSAAGAQSGIEDWGRFGIQTQWIDGAVKPGDDFDGFVNGKWNASYVMPEDRTRVGAFMALRDLSEDRVHVLLEDMGKGRNKPGSPEARLSATYKAFMDTDAIDAAGLAPARPYLDRIFAARTHKDLAVLFGSTGFASPIGAGITADQKQSDTYALYVGHGDLGLPDRDYYLVDSDKNRELRAKYLDLLTFMLGKAGYQDAPGAAKAVLALETEVARTMWDRAASRNRDLTYNKLSMAELTALDSQGLMRTFTETLGVAALGSAVVVQMPPTADELAAARIDAAAASAKFSGGVPATLALVEKLPVATWQAWLASRFLSDNASRLPSDIDAANFAFYGTVLIGQPKQRPRWKRGVEAVEGQIGELLGTVYVQRHFPAQNKAAMDGLVANLRKAMAANLVDLAWMGPETRKEAQAKLDAFSPKIGHPAAYKTYKGLALSATDPLANAIAAQDWAWDYNLARIDKPVDRDEWHMLPQTVNAYYNPTGNEIVFPAGILQPPFFNLSADPAVNYGAIGGVIGHEMGHGFDDQGAKSDGQGNLRDWWTAQDKANFVRLQDKLGAQYDAYCPFDGGKTCVSGKLTMGENIGDLGGLSLAYRAYQLSLDGKEAPVIDGFTGDQRFFMAWAQVWRSKVREAQARQYLIADPHSPPQYRVNGIVRNFGEWYKAFGVKPGDALYLPPEERVRIW